MRTTCNALCDFTVSVNDADLGRIKDIYFDDETWLVRYLVVDTRKWLPGRRVLLSPKQVALLDPRTQTIRFDLTKDQLRKAPSLAEHLPVTRSHEIALHDFFGWQPYWGGAGAIDLRLPLDAAGARILPTLLDVGPSMIRQEDEPHLESAKDLQGFTVQSVGRLERGTQGQRLGDAWDFVINYVDWTIPFFVVEEDLGVGSRKFVLPTLLITAIDGDASTIRTEEAAHMIEKAASLEDVSQLGAPG